MVNTNMSDDYPPENGEQDLASAPPARILLRPPPSARINLDGDNYAVLEHGIIKIFLKDERHLFSVDANTVTFERKVLGAVLQVYLLGYQNGKVQERAQAKQRIITAINLLFE